MTRLSSDYLYQKNMKNQGFTLVEVLIVIVILALFAGMMTLSVHTSDGRRNKAFYEHLTSNINYVRLLSIEQMKPYGLAIKLAKNDSNSQIMVVKLEKNPTIPKNDGNASLNNANVTTPPSWQIEKQIEPLDIPSNIDISIDPLDTLSSNASNSTTPNWLVGEQAPPVVWFGTGEATPVQISVKAKNGDGQVFLVDDPIVINATGSIELPNSSDTLGGQNSANNVQTGRN